MLNQPKKQVTDEIYGCHSMLLINNEAELLVGSEECFYLLKTTTLERIKKFEVQDANVMDIFNIEDSKNALIIIDIGQLYKLDCKTKELSLVKEDATGDGEGIAKSLLI